MLCSKHHLRGWRVHFGEISLKYYYKHTTYAEGSATFVEQKATMALAALFPNRQFGDAVLELP